METVMARVTEPAMVIVTSPIAQAIVQTRLHSNSRLELAAEPAEDKYFFLLFSFTSNTNLNSFKVSNNMDNDHYERL